jgi:hypothetical protein
VIDATQAAILIAPENQRRPAMRTGLIDQANAPLGVPEGNKILAQQPDALWLAIARQIG